MIDSFSEKREGNLTWESENLKLICNFAKNHGVLEYVLLPDKGKGGRNILCLPKQLLHTVWVMLTPAILSLEFDYAQSFSFPDSQLAAYGTKSDYPIFGGCNGLDVNMEWLLHNVNFWKYHMLRPAENTLYPSFSALAADKTPRFWRDQLVNGVSKLGTYWKGSYAYIEREEIDDLRASNGGNIDIQDQFNGDEAQSMFQDMRLEWIEPDRATWPQIFEDHLNSLQIPASKARTRAQHRSATPEAIAGFRHQNFQFCGEGCDDSESFLAQGWLNAVPPQEDIPGWQRMTMMKYFEDPVTGRIDEDALWAYEGVVLPGGQIIMGRWWSTGDGTDEDMYSGPFILWCVDGP